MSNLSLTIIFLALYVAYIPLYSGYAWRKFRGDGLDRFINKFEESFLRDRHRLLNFLYRVFALMEAVVPILYIISIFRLEFLPHHHHLFFSLAISWQMVILALYMTGNVLVKDFKTIMAVFTWMSTVLLSGLLLMLAS
ncbi:MAG: hypothetical protein GY821_18210 [Gammaproteobacteria bacterium]|nr:hypothetical protein [Gammaproteobacteria bacterium]MCP4476454.1 hypothetical protein [Gammaproteobacteria bacterium]